MKGQKYRWEIYNIIGMLLLIVCVTYNINNDQFVMIVTLYFMIGIILYVVYHYKDKNVKKIEIH